MSETRRPRRAHAIRVLATVAAIAFASLGCASPALAHGERSQVSFLRTRTITFYDVHFSTTSPRVGDRFSITGRFYARRAWPHSAPEPETAALTVATLGPVVLVKDRRIGGQFVPQSISLEKGRSYDFRIDLVARRAGFYHIHPLIALEGAGPLVGPGEWLTIGDAPGGGEFHNELSLQSGERVDLETFNRGTVLTWHLIYLIPAALFLVYWLRKPIAQRLAAGGVHAAELNTSRDLKFSGAIGALALILVGVGAAYAATTWPDTIPLQVRKSNPPGQPVGEEVTARVVQAAHFVPARDELEVRVRLENRSREQLRLESFATGSGDVLFDPQGDPHGRKGLLHSDAPAGLAPGKSEEVTLSLRSERWKKDNLIPGNEVDLSIGGLLIFRTPDESSRAAEVTIPILPEAGHR